ncbi:MAG: hypothetical protein K9K66_18655 [Desulfarculaceae bacterium]|nr:hypothetical protein [Desulfarculaceae bacterium]MCF8074478.1 hypothetical protein [Desulfarculaceae bacterium]MCF8103680.1 hypothetical protein [Desulfarculaceae bacterium]MCF8118008.1 hypothetical protein [Desulfarculaceae bacterium]
MRKVILIVMVVLVVAAAGATYYAYNNMDRFAKGVLQDAASKALGVPVTVDSVDLQFGQRQAVIKGLTVANPPGYSRQAAISFDSVTVQVGFGQADIEKIEAVAPVIRVELKGKANNLAQLRARAQRASGKASPAEGSGGSRSKGPVFHVGLLKVQGAQAILTGPEIKQPVRIGVKNLELRNLEGTGSQLAGQIFARLLGVTLEQAASAAVQRGLGKVINKEASYGEGVTNYLEKLGGVKK